MSTDPETNSGKLPAIQFYPADWRKDPGIQSLSYHDRGVWFEILCLMHESQRRGVLLLNAKPMPDEALARILGLDKQILTTTLTTLLTSGVASREEGTDALMNRRMVRDEYLRKVRSEAGKRGGNPLLLNQIPTTPVKQIPTPSSSSSSSSSSSDHTRPAPSAPDAKEEPEDLEMSLPKPADSQPPKPRPRDPLFDALARSCGSNPLEMPSPQARACAVALAAIRKVCPTLTPEEIASRAATYQRIHKDWNLTPSALCSHWGECGVSALPATGDPRIRGRIDRTYTHF